jgi:protein transport protein SEC24
LVFQSSIPLYGPGGLKQRDAPKLFGTDKEQTLHKPQSTFYGKLGEECTKKCITVDLFLFSRGYVDVASLGKAERSSLRARWPNFTIAQLPRKAGGNVYYYPCYNPAIHQEKLYNEIKRNMTRPTVYDTLMRVRTSSGTLLWTHNLC